MEDEGRKALKRPCEDLVNFASASDDNYILCLVGREIVPRRRRYGRSLSHVLVVMVMVMLPPVQEESFPLTSLIEAYKERPSVKLHVERALAAGATVEWTAGSLVIRFKPDY